MNPSVGHTRRYRLFSALLALVLWGGWSFYVNAAQQGWQRGVLSGAAQGVCSFAITLLMTRLIEIQYSRYRAGWRRCWLPPLVTVLLTGSGLVLVHTAVGTPAIARTVTPALSVALLFAFFTNHQLQRQARIRTESAQR